MDDDWKATHRIKYGLELTPTCTSPFGGVAPSAPAGRPRRAAFRPRFAGKAPEGNDNLGRRRCAPEPFGQVAARRPTRLGRRRFQVEGLDVFAGQPQDFGRRQLGSRTGGQLGVQARGDEAPCLFDLQTAGPDRGPAARLNRQVVPGTEPPDLVGEGGAQAPASVSASFLRGARLIGQAQPVRSSASGASSGKSANTGPLSALSKSSAAITTRV